MKKNEQLEPTPRTSDPAPRRAPAYEPPRIVSKRSVERVTLASGVIGPGGPPIGGE